MIRSPSLQGGEAGFFVTNLETFAGVALLQNKNPCDDCEDDCEKCKHGLHVDNCQAWDLIMGMRFMMYDGFGGVNTRAIEYALKDIPKWQHEEMIQKIAAFVAVDRKIEGMKKD
ncbi:MAG TPA: hypothetical protein ENI05_12985 [Porticoccus sp.]|nr:hypothetical protein [Porticoccus sp.]